MGYRMKISKKVKKIIKRIPGVKPLLRYERPGCGTVYMLHRVCPHNPAGLYPNENLKVSPEFLERFIIKKRKKYDFISLDSLTEIINSGIKPKRPFICFTLDDGYKDNLKYAASIFEKHKVPYAIYVTACFPNRTAFLWWFILEDIILNNSSIKLSNGTTFSAKNKDEKEETFLAVRTVLLENSKTDFKETFYSLLADYTHQNSFDLNTYALSWEDITTLAASPLCTIGAHTKNHAALSKLDKVSALEEIMQGKNELENKLGKPVVHFAYPYGSAAEVSEREYDLAKNSGFKTAVLSYGGNFKVLAPQKLYSLPRKLLSDL